MSERTALVTGASSGIGESTARRLARDGWRVLLVARREERLKELSSELRDSAHLAVDLTDEDAPPRVRARVDELWGRLDLLVNNAGWSERADFADGGYDNVKRVMEINFDAVLRLTEALLPVLRGSAPSAIVNVSSIAGRVGRAKMGAYTASKFALAGWTDCLRMEEKRHRVHVGLVLPGFVSTEGFPQSELTSSARTRWLVSTPDKVADAIVRAADGKPEVAVPRPWGLVPRLRYGLPGVARRLGG
ncbi:MAG TPA: SDR family NAD(P)-dependent oxidoreductase [Thermoleophilaceae bacterium]|nr:SDR family NAD(P)-dependent oxidoreductase [Thermoleophilaceae bacterium]